MLLGMRRIGVCFRDLYLSPHIRRWSGDTLLYSTFYNAPNKEFRAMDCHIVLLRDFDQVRQKKWIDRKKVKIALKPQTKKWMDRRGMYTQFPRHI